MQATRQWGPRTIRVLEHSKDEPEAVRGTTRCFCPTQGTIFNLILIYNGTDSEKLQALSICITESLRMVTAAMKIKRRLVLGEKL